MVHHSCEAIQSTLIYQQSVLEKLPTTGGLHPLFMGMPEVNSILVPGPQYYKENDRL